MKNTHVGFNAISLFKVKGQKMEKKEYDVLDAHGETDQTDKLLVDRQIHD